MINNVMDIVCIVHDAIMAYRLNFIYMNRSMKEELMTWQIYLMSNRSSLAHNLG